MTCLPLRRLAPVGLACALVAACNQQPAPASSEGAPPPAASEAAPTANPAVRAPDVAITPVGSTANVIAAQPGPGGSTWELTKVKVTGNLLTVQWTVRPRVKTSATYYGSVADISLVDDATSQRYGVVEDQSGQPMVSDVSGDSFRVSASRDETAIAWAKFAAPPATSTTVSINVPKVGAFDGVPVTR